MPLLPLLPDLNLVLLFFLIGIHSSFPTAFTIGQEHDDVDCEALVWKSFRLDGEEWEVIEADASSGLVKYARLCEGDTEHKRSHWKSWKRSH